MTAKARAEINANAAAAVPEQASGGDVTSDQPGRSSPGAVDAKMYSIGGAAQPAK
jgi:hypothetical protein